MNAPLTIEFFHDVICSFCYPMSYRMRLLQKEMPGLAIVHRSFALAMEPEDLALMFGSRPAAKQEILRHWAAANQNDDLHRFNIEGMQRQSFPFPTSKKPLLACKAAGLAGGEEAYWAVFDALQKALFTENLNIEDTETIAQKVRQAPVSFARWQALFAAPETMLSVKEDLALAQSYGITSVPTLVVNGKYRVSGAQPLPALQNALQTIQAENAAEPGAGESCSLQNGTLQCN
ncbi:MAG: DsbA family protein [Oscillospiraceae bacterium]